MSKRAEKGKCRKNFAFSKLNDYCLVLCQVNVSKMYVVMNECSKLLSFFVLLPLFLLGIKFAVSDIIVVLPHCKFRPYLMVELLILLSDQAIYLLNFHIVLFQTRLIGVFYPDDPFWLLLFAVMGIQWPEFFVVDGGLWFVFGLYW